MEEEKAANRTFLKYIFGAIPHHCEFQGGRKQALLEEGLWQSTAMVLLKKSQGLRVIQESWGIAAPGSAELSCNCL